MLSSPVPEKVRLLPGLIVKLPVTIICAPDARDKFPQVDPMVRFPEYSGQAGTEEGIITAVVLSGIIPLFQLAGVFQSLDMAPVHWLGAVPVMLISSTAQ